MEKHIRQARQGHREGVGAVLRTEEDVSEDAELPSTRTLVRSTVISAIVAIVLLVTTVLPAEYGVDPTGIGRTLGLTQMGELKLELAREAALDARADSIAAGMLPADSAK